MRKLLTIRSLILMFAPTLGLSTAAVWESEALTIPVLLRFSSYSKIPFATCCGGEREGDLSPSLTVAFMRVALLAINKIELNLYLQYKIKL